MKRQIKLAIFMAFAALTVASCNKSDIPGFKKTENGLHYKFEVQNKKAQKVEMGDVIVGEVLMRINNDTLFSNVGNPQRIMQVSEGMFEGDLPEGLQMMHVGDKAIFAVDADKMAEFFQGQMPPQYTPNNGDKVYYEITISDVVTAEEIQQEQANFQAEMEQRKADEPAAIEKYLADNNITGNPTESGLYIVVRQKGNGPKVVAGKTVEINYTGRLLDGTIFDSSVEKDAREGNIYQEGRPYEPLKYKVGEMSLIPGWDEGVQNQPAGSKLTLIMPSSLGYGERGAGAHIMPYSPLVFDIEIVSVK